MPSQRDPNAPRWRRNLTIADNVRVQLQIGPRMFRLIEEVDGCAIMVTPAMRGMELTMLTVEELDLFERFVAKAIATARPVCVDLDARAEEALESGGPLYKRSFRPKPVYLEV